MNLSESCSVRASKEQLSCDLGGEAAILHLKSGIYYGLDPVGARIWNLLQSPTTVREIREKIVGEYEVDEARCEADLLALIKDLAAAELIEVSE